MKFWYHPGFEMYVAKNPYWEDGDKWNDELVEVDLTKEELIVEGGSNDPCGHAGRWETEWEEKGFAHMMLNKIPWPTGKYKITIEPVDEVVA